jgi:hypothetical protein
MNDLKHLVTERTGRRCTDTSSMWAFACGMGWAFVLMVIVDGVMR